MNIPRFGGALVFSIFLLASPLTGQAGAVNPGDFDDDVDVDLADFAEFQTCALGPAIPQADPECTDARLDADPDVDLDDFEVFHGCLSGAENPADPNCACPLGQTNCDGTCVSTATDNANCGTCDHRCVPAWLTCENGWCVSPSPCFGGQLWCDGACREVLLNPSNCGGCGIICDGGQYCAGGLCWCWDCG